MMRQVKLQDIAGRAGVSVVTVSKVLNPNSTGNNTKVSEETAKRIRAIARALDYHPNLAARRLAGGSSRLLGLLLDTQSSPMEFARVAYMEKAAASRGYRVLISQCNGTQENIRFCLDNFASHGLDGAILLSNSFPNLNAWIVEYAKQLQHVVYYDRPLHDDGSCDYVEVDLAAGLRQLVDHLVETGRRRIAYFLPYSGFPCGKYPSMLARESGFTRGMAAHGLPFDPEFTTRFQFDILPGQPELVKRLMKFIRAERPDAIIARNDIFAMVVLRALHELGIRCPDDIALAGYDNFEFTESLIPSLTTVDNRLPEVSECAVDILIHRIENKGPASRCARLFTPRLIVRESTAAVRSGSSAVRDDCKQEVSTPFSVL